MDRPDESRLGPLPSLDAAAQREVHEHLRLVRDAVRAQTHDAAALLRECGCPASLADVHEDQS